jgi:hypothetical protein
MGTGQSVYAIYIRTKWRRRIFFGFPYVAFQLLMPFSFNFFVHFYKKNIFALVFMKIFWSGLFKNFLI